MPDMSMSMQPRQDMRLTMALAPRMIQSMEILQMPIMALQEKIQQELQENPVLELKEPTLEETAPEDEVPGPADDEGDAEVEALRREWDEQYNEEHRPSRNRIDEEGDKKHDAMQNMASRPQSLQDYLADQLTFVDATREQLQLVRHVIAHLADNGYLGRFDEKGHFTAITLEEIAAGFDRPVTAQAVEAALRVVQKLDPPGVGARNLKECLLLQLDADDNPHRDVLRLLILNHLEDIEHNRLPIIQRRTGFDIPAIKAAIELLKQLNPKPGSRFQSENIPYVVPDILVERKDDGEYDVRLVDDWVPNIYISRRYVELYREKGADPKAKEYLKRKIQAAQWLLDSIEQRRNTLMKVTRAIIQHQRAFLDVGPDHIEPLKMQQIADQVGVHVTTVSRAVDDKWVQTPRGIFPLKRFFGGGTQTASGEEVAWETIKQKLLEIIDKEDKSNPWSDEDLVNQLQEAGYPVARRTVTKYRKILKIPSSRQRKDWELEDKKGPTAAVETPHAAQNRHVRELRPLPHAEPDLDEDHEPEDSLAEEVHVGE